MQATIVRRLAFTIAASCMAALVPLSVYATTTAQAMSSVAFLRGSWHCAGDGPPEDDVYTFTKNEWRDTDNLGGVTTGTFHEAAEVGRVLHGHRWTLWGE